MTIFFLSWVTVKMLEDPEFEIISEQIKPILLTYLALPDDEIQTELAKNLPIRFPKNWAHLKEAVIDGQDWGAAYVAKRCKVM